MRVFSFGRLVLLAALAGVLLVCAAFLPRLIALNGRKEVLARTAAVVTAVRDLSRLETASYHIERVIDLRDEQRRLFGLLEGEDAVLLVAAGDVSAGIDLSALMEGDVQIDGAMRRVTLRLPAAQIFHAALDEGRTFVHTRRTDLLARRDERLEGRARELAVSSFEHAAREMGITDRAQKQAERVLRALLRDLGFQEVTILFRPPQ